ncbi:unnamed protein product, partial [Onchocerca ochengi]
LVLRAIGSSSDSTVLGVALVIVAGPLEFRVRFSTGSSESSSERFS